MCIRDRLSHPNIVPIYSVDEVGNLVFFVMACIDGDNLATLVQKRGPLPIENVRRWLGEVSDALSYAHSRGVVHRDIKPDNILLDGIDGRALVTEFVIAGAFGINQAEAPSNPRPYRPAPPSGPVPHARCHAHSPRPQALINFCVRALSSRHA